jgi:oligopeptide transport system permease protein
MLLYCLKRLARSLVSLCAIVAIVFCLLRLMPIEGYFSNFDKMSPQQVANAVAKLGLDKPIHVQLAGFFKQLSRGDLGTSNKYRVDYPISSIILYKAPVSIRFGLLAMLVSVPLGMGLGVLMARRERGWWDRLGTAYVIFIQAVPSAIYFLFVQLYGSSAFGLSILYDSDKPSSMILPILSLAMPSIASYAMWQRRYMVDEANKDYIKLARAKGVPATAIAFKHVFRNSIVPMVQLIPESLLLTIAGSIYVESLYSIPGMGGLLVDVIKRQDNTMVQALVIVFAALSIVGLLLGDLLMALVDPRIDLVKKEGVR